MATSRSETPQAPAETSVAPDSQPSELTRITRVMISIYKHQFGRGPNFAHSYYAGPDAIVCILEGTLTPVEKTLAAIGEIQQLQNLRQLFQAAAEGEFRSGVEEITGRRVVSFLSANDVRTDVASEMFVFAPRASSGVATA